MQSSVSTREAQALSSRSITLTSDTLFDVGPNYLVVEYFERRARSTESADVRELLDLALPDSRRLGRKPCVIGAHRSTATV